jgi:plastocyanin domain-containing protein
MKIYSLLLVAILVACAADKKPAPAAATVRRVELSVTENGFEPTPVKVKQGEPLELVVTRKTDKTCATDIVVKDHDIKKALPLNEPVVVAFTPSKTGELRYGCAMDQMVAGVLLVE